MPDNGEAVHLWNRLSDHSRPRIGMEGLPDKIRLADIRAEADRTADPVDLFEKVLLIESMFYPKLLDDINRRRKSAV